MTSEKQFFIHLRDTAKKHPNYIVELFTEYKTQQDIPARILRKVIQLVLADVLCSNPLLPPEEAKNWLLSKMPLIEMHHPLYKQYITASLMQQTLVLKQIRTKMNTSAMEFGSFAPQRYIHSAAIDIKDWETAVILHGKFSQFIGNKNQEEKAASPKTLAILRTRLEQGLRYLPAEEQLTCFLEILKNPFPHSISEKYLKRNVALENLFHGLLPIRWTHRGLDQSFGSNVQYCSQDHSFFLGSEERKHLFSQMSPQLCSSWIASLASMREQSQQYALRILSHSSLDKEQQDTVYSIGTKNLCSDVGVFLLLQLGWTRKHDVPELHFSPPQVEPTKEETVRALKLIIQTEKQTSLEQTALLLAVFNHLPILALELFDDLLVSTYRDAILTSLPLLPQDTSILPQLPRFIEGIQNETLPKQWRIDFHHILYSKFSQDLFLLPEDTLIAYLNSTIPNAQSKSDVLEHRDITLPCSALLISFCMNNALQSIRQSFAQHLKKHPVETYKNCSTALIDLFLSPYLDVQDFFDTHVLDVLNKIVSNLEHSLTMRWLTAEQEQFVSLSSRFSRGALGQALQTIIEQESSALLHIIQQRIPTKTTKEAECIHQILIRVNDSHAYGHNIIERIIRQDKNTNLKDWSRTILSKGCLAQDTSSVLLLDTLLKESSHNSTILEYVKMFSNAVFHIWFSSTEHAFSTTIEAFYEKQYWLATRVFSLFSYEQVKSHTSIFLSVPHEETQVAFRPFLLQIIERDPSFLGTVISDNIQNMYLHSAAHQKVFAHNVNTPNLYQKTFSYVQEALFTNINVLASHPTLRHLLLGYLKIAPQSAMVKNTSLTALMNAQYDDIRAFAWKWLCDHLPTSIDFFGDIFFTQLHLLHTISASDLRIARAQEIYNYTEEFFDIFVPLHRKKVFALTHAVLLEESEEHAYLVSLAVELLAHLPKETWSENQTLLLQVVLSHRPSIYTKASVLLRIALEDTASAESIALRFFDHITSISMHDKLHREHCITLFEKHIATPLKEIIIRDPEQYVDKIQQFISSEERTIQEIGISLLHVIPAALIIEKTELMHWLLFSSQAHLLPLIIEKLSQATKKKETELVDFSYLVFDSLTQDTSSTRFHNLWNNLFSLFTPTLLLIQQENFKKYTQWLTLAQKEAPNEDLHLGLFSALTPKHRETQSSHFLSFFQSPISAQEFTKLFVDINVEKLVPNILGYKNLNAINNEKLLWFMDTYPDPIHAHISDPKNISLWVNLFKKTKDTNSIYHTITQRLFDQLPPTLIQENHKLQKQIIEHPILTYFPNYKSKIKAVLTKEFVQGSMESVLMIIKENRHHPPSDPISENISFIFSEILYPELITEYTTASNTYLDILQSMLGVPMLDEKILEVFFRTPTQELLRRPNFQQKLWQGTSQALRDYSVPILQKMMMEHPQFAQKQFAKINEELTALSKKINSAHMTHLLNHLFFDLLIEKQKSNPKSSIKFIDETLLNLDQEDYHVFGMKLFAELPLSILKDHGRDLLLRSFDHKSAGVRSGITLTFDKIWNNDPQWGSKLLVSLIEKHLLKAKRIELITLIQTYLQKENSFLSVFLEEKKLILAQHVAHLILSPQASDVKLTKARFSLGCTMIDILPPHAFFKEIELIIHLSLSTDERFQEMGTRLIKGNSKLGDIFRTKLGNGLMNELKSDQKFTVQGANVFNFHFAPPAGSAVPNNLNEYTLTRKVHQFPDFDQGLLPPQNPQTLIGPNVDDQSKTAGIGFAFNYGGKPYTSCKVDSNGWLRFEGNFSGSTYVNDTAYKSNNASMVFIWWQDLRTAHDGYLRTWIQGEEGQRIRVFEWRTFAVYTQSKSDNRTLNMQICLHEGSNKIVFRFGALEPRGNSNKSRTAVCGAKLGNNRTRTGQFRDFFGSNGTPPGSAPPFRKNLRCDGKQKNIDYPGIIRDKAAEARFDAVVLERYKKTMLLLEEYCSNVLSVLNLEEVSHLIHHPKKEIRDFGGRIIKIHKTHPDQYPSRLILELFMVQDKSLQKIRDEILERLTITGLQQHRSIWLKFIASNVKEHQKQGEQYITKVMNHSIEYHLSMLKELFEMCNAQIGSNIFLGGHKSIFERLITETPKEQINKEETLLFDGYFSTHATMRAYFIDIAHEALKNSRSMAFLFWDTLLQRKEDNSISESQSSALQDITSIVDIHIQNIKGEDLRSEDWWFPRLTSPIRMVRATMAPLLGVYAQSYPALAIECAQELLKKLKEQVLAGQVDGAPPKYDNLRGRAAIEALCHQFPDDRRVDYCSFWLRMFLHLHPEIRERGKVQLLQLLTDTAVDSDYKRVLDMLLRQLLKNQPFKGATQQVIAFIRINISSRLHLVSERILFRLLDSRDEEACSFGIYLMRQKFSADRISLEKMILLSGYDFVEVRRYAWELMEASVHRFREDFSQTIRFLEVKWEDTRQLAFTICRENLLDAWNIENVIRVCDSVREDVRNFGLEQLQVFLLGKEYEQASWSNGDQDTLTELARRLSQHPSMEVEAFLMKLFEEHEKEAMAPPLLAHPDQLTLLIPCFKRIFSRVHKARSIKSLLWELIKTRAHEDQEKAQSLYPLLSWLSGTHLKKDKVQAIALMLSIQLKFPGMSFSTDQHHLLISRTSSPKNAK